MKILFTYENPLPNPEADAEVFVSNARAIAALCDGPCRIHVPLPRGADTAAVDGIEVVRARVPLRPAALRHLLCAVTLVWRRAFREADLVYTRNLWVARWALAFGQRVVFDHYRPWSDQIPPLQGWIRRILCHRRMLVHICHSRYTQRIYLCQGVPESRVECVHNGYDPARLGTPMEIDAAKRALGLPAQDITVVYTGRINPQKGIETVVAAARQLPAITFVLVGSYGEGPIERSARDLPNVRIFPWQADAELAKFLAAADILLIPPSAKPLQQYGGTVLPLKTFLYLGAGRAIVAGDTPDLREILDHGRNAYLCRTDSTEALVAALRTLAEDPGLRTELGAAARRDARGFTWEARARRILEIIGPRLALARHGPTFRARMRRTARWFVNLVLRRSWILPPDAGAPPCGNPPDRD